MFCKINKDDNLNVRFNLHQAAVAGKGAAGRTFISGKHVHAAAVIDSLGIRFIPGTGIQAGDTGHYAVGDLGKRPQFSASIIDDHTVAIGNIAMTGVVDIYPDFIVAFFL